MGKKTNQAFINKADMVVADLASDGGYMPPTSTARFLRLAINESVIMSQCRVIPLPSPVHRVPKIRFNSRIMRAGSEGTPVSAADRAKPDTSMIEFTTKKIIAEVDLDEEVVEDNIEGDSFRNTVTALMAERAGLDVEDLALNGDETDADPYLATLDGFRVQATSNLVDAGGDILNQGVLKDIFKKMPTEFRKRKRNLRFWTGSNATVDYSDTITNRMTALGDRVLTDDEFATWSSIPVVDVPIYPDELGVGTNETEVLLTDPMNAVVAFWRRIKVRSEFLTRSGIYVVVASMRLDVKWEHEPAVVKCTDVVSQAA